MLDLLIDGELGIWHISNPGRVSWAELYQLLARAGGFDPDRIVVEPGEAIWAAPRPRDVSLGSTRGSQLSELGPAVERFVNDTRLVQINNPPHPSADARDPIVREAAG